MYEDLYELEVLLNTFNAFRELLFSAYFCNFIGSDLQTDPQYDLYFLTLHQTKPLQTVLSQAKYKLT